MELLTMIVAYSENYHSENDQWDPFSGDNATSAP